MSLGDAGLRLGEPLSISGHPRTLCRASPRAPPKIRFDYELGLEFSGREAGARWEDFKIGVDHLSRSERVAVVTDVEWIRCAVKCLRLRDARRSPALRRVRSACHSRLDRDGARVPLAVIVAMVWSDFAFRKRSSQSRACRPALQIRPCSWTKIRDRLRCREAAGVFLPSTLLCGPWDRPLR